jgi:hypothetical protein
MLSPQYGALRDVVRRQDNQGPKIIIDAGYGEISYISVQQHGRSADIVLFERLLMDRMLQRNRPTSAHGC